MPEAWDGRRAGDQSEDRGGEWQARRDGARPRGRRAVAPDRPGPDQGAGEGGSREAVGRRPQRSTSWPPTSAPRYPAGVVRGRRMGSRPASTSMPAA
ncbi:hypothetical protein AB5I41_16510 [Sphingomonas sp. MMS24-JH45]